jgi:NTE family protein
MVGFVLAGGASLGAIEVGMLRALYERAIVPELIVGTSVGAVNGAYIASRPATVETSESLAKLWRSITTFEVFPPNPVTATLGLLGHRDHLVPNFGLKKLLRRYADFERMQDAPISFHVIATDVLSGAEVRLSEGDASSAVLASAAIPGVYPSIECEGRELVDGGVADNTPIAQAAELGADEIYVLPTGAPCALTRIPRGAVSMLVHALSLLINERLARDVQRFSQRAQLIVLPPPCPADVLASDFGHSRRLIEEGHRLSAAALDHPDPAGYWTPRSLERLLPHHH